MHLDARILIVDSDFGTGTGSIHASSPGCAHRRRTRSIRRNLVRRDFPVRNHVRTAAPFRESVPNRTRVWALSRLQRWPLQRSRKVPRRGFAEGPVPDEQDRNLVCPRSARKRREALDHQIVIWPNRLSCRGPFWSESAETHVSDTWCPHRRRNPRPASLSTRLLSKERSARVDRAVLYGDALP